ncbi:phage holin family protein [Nitrosospira multiformis]|jgi:putative membrane protein|uniref:phage holin family protein n=1 Tax=Nitrosospira multiformis TaxID=1231 RepID=UPI00089BEC59|nr:phage holin family protein [Nitrosospira multiformis]SEA26367.1 putative membrane protein [Nitrosospira multiformis]
MLDNMMAFLAHWGVTSLSLWVASLMFHGISFSSKKSLLISALLLGLVNAVVKPVIIILTIPLTLITFGFFLLVINALMMMLVSALVPGFRVSGFWTAFFASIVVTIVSLFIGTMVFQSEENYFEIPTQQKGVMI